MKLEFLEDQKLTAKVFRKTLIFGKNPKNVSRKGFFGFSKKLIHWCAFFYLKMVLNSVFCGTT